MMVLMMLLRPTLIDTAIPVELYARGFRESRLWASLRAYTISSCRSQVEMQVPSCCISWSIIGKTTRYVRRKGCRIPPTSIAKGYRLHNEDFQNHG